MSTINTNIASLTAIHHLQANTGDLNKRMERLASGLRINTGKDDPAGLIASENLRAQIGGIDQVIDNASRASNVIGTAEGALNEVSALLVELQALVTEAANSGALSQEELEANQLQVDSILASINRISNSTSFNGLKLLNGTFEYATSSLAASAITAVQTYAARVPVGGSLPVVVEVTGSAEFAQLKFSGAGLGSAETVSVQVAGTKGSEVVTFTASTAVSAMAAAINQFTSVTGVSATVSGTAAMYFNSTGYGSGAFVSVEPVEGAFAVGGGDSATRDTGADADVLINGQAATVNGLVASQRSNTLDVEVMLTTAFASTLATTTFGVTGGGAKFQLSPHVDAGGQTSLAIPSISTGSLGRPDVGYLSSLGTGGSAALTSGDAPAAQDILDVAIKHVAVIRGRLGAFQKTILDPNVNALQVALENVTASQSAIRDADFAIETAALTRAQILVQANTSVLSMANAAPQAVLALLQG